MRRTVVFAVIALLAAGDAAAQGNWKEFTYSRDGFAAQYPAEPKVEEHAYKTALGSGVTERVYAYNSGGVVYQVAIADFSRIRPDKDKAIDEAATALIGSGSLPTTSPPASTGITAGKSASKTPTAPATPTPYSSSTTSCSSSKSFIRK